MHISKHLELIKDSVLTDFMFFVIKCIIPSFYQNVCMYVCVCMYVYYVCMYVYMYVCMHVCMHIHAHLHESNCVQ